MKFFGASLPEIGEKIEITWLPPCRNSINSKNPYIGMSGVVDSHLDGGGFVLQTESAILVITGRFSYKKIKT